jgi:hypothetical protein
MQKRNAFSIRIYTDSGGRGMTTGKAFGLSFSAFSSQLSAFGYSLFVFLWILAFGQFECGGGAFVCKEGRKEAVKVGHGFIDVFFGGRAYRGSKIDTAALAAENLLPGMFVADVIRMPALFAFKVYHHRISLFLER